MRWLIRMRVAAGESIDDPLQPEHAGVPERGGTVFAGVLIVDDAPDQFRQPGLALGKRTSPKIIAFDLERSNAYSIASVTVPRRWSASKTATPSGPHTAASPSIVNDLAPELRCGPGDRWIAPAPVMASTGEQAHVLAVAADDQPIPVMFDFLHPIRAERRLVPSFRGT
jgi:hypothetical protein